MKISYTYEDHHSAGSEWEQRGEKLKEWLSNVFEAPELKIAPRCTTVIRRHVSGMSRLLLKL